jgi:hypothetical protein
MGYYIKFYTKNAILFIENCILYQNEVVFYRITC